MADPLDMTGTYNTPLPPGTEAFFQSWLRDQGQQAGRDMSRDTYDYDMQGAFLGGAGRSGANDHWPDTFKKPNHPSFSDQSIYHGQDGHQGGAWQPTPDGGWRFAPGPTNLQMHGPEGLQRYFQQVDPGVQLDIPNAAPVAPEAPTSMLDYIRAQLGAG